MRVLLIETPSIAAYTQEIVDALTAAGVEVVSAGMRALEDPDLDAFEIVAGPGAMRWDAARMDRSPRLRGLVAAGVGCEGFDRDAAAARRIAIATASPADNAPSMASASIMLMLALCHDLPGAQEALRRGGQRDVARTRLLDDATVGLIGFGAIGRETARRLRLWNVDVVATSPSFQSGVGPHGARGLPLADLLRVSDIVSLHAALTPASRSVLGRRALAQMKRGALIVNTARGALIDDEALVEALHDGRIGGAALDCFASEPLPMDSPLRSAPNVILTPHQIGHTTKGGERMVARFIENIIRIARSPRLVVA